jgi:hypothetical protein
MNDDEQVSDGETNEAPVLVPEEISTTIDQSWLRRNAIEYAIQAGCYKMGGGGMDASSAHFRKLMEQAEVIYQFIIGGKNES